MNLGSNAFKFARFQGCEKISCEGSPLSAALGQALAEEEALPVGEGHAHLGSEAHLRQVVLLIHQQTIANELKIAEAKRLDDEERARRASLVDGLRAFGWRESKEQPSATPPPAPSAAAPSSGGSR